MEKREKRGDLDTEGRSVGRRLVGDVRFGGMTPKHITTDSAPHAPYSSRPPESSSFPTPFSGSSRLRFWTCCSAALQNGPSYPWRSCNSARRYVCSAYETQRLIEVRLELPYTTPSRFLKIKLKDWRCSSYGGLFTHLASPHGEQHKALHFRVQFHLGAFQ